MYHLTRKAAILKAPHCYLWKRCWPYDGRIRKTPRGQSLRQMEFLQETQERFSLPTNSPLRLLKVSAFKVCLGSEWHLNLWTACHTTPLYCPRTTAGCSPWENASPNRSVSLRQHWLTAAVVLKRIHSAMPLLAWLSQGFKHFLLSRQIATPTVTFYLDASIWSLVGRKGSSTHKSPLAAN